jgi:hemerythrin-like domain-containing protein
MAIRAARILTFEPVTCSESTLNGRDPSGAGDHRPRFDRREMLVVHDVFRREFGLMPGLVAAVAVGDRSRAVVVGDHIDVLTSLLHHHHHGEDTYAWPLLMDRCSDSVAALGLMHQQHEQLDVHLDAVNTALAAWRVDATAATSHRLFVALDRTLPSLQRHLDDEERYVVPVMEQHITAGEWDDIVAKGSADADAAGLPLRFGMLMYEGDPEIIERVLAAMPADSRPVITAMAAQAFAEHSLAVHGTPTPPRSAELMGSRHA